MMGKEYKKRIMKKDGETCNDRHYKYKMNSKKKAIANKEGLASDE
jgi:hypothetical protein